MKNLIIRLLFGLVFLVSLVSAVIASWGASISIDAINLHSSFSDKTVFSDCAKAIERGEYNEELPCVMDQWKYLSVLSIGFYVAVIFGLTGLVFLTVGIYSLRKHLRRIRFERQGAM